MRGLRVEDNCLCHAIRANKETFMTVADLPSDNRADDDGAAHDAPANAGEGKGARGLRAIWPSRWRWRIALSVLVIAALVLIAAWLGRERITQNVIGSVRAKSKV